MDLTLKRTESLVDAFETINDKSNFQTLVGFRRTVYGFKILIDVMYCEFSNANDVICTKEYLTKKVSYIASRATIINFINDQISIGTLIANTSLIDGRIKVVTPSKALKNDYQLWLEHLAG
jgi:hypothetical protein